MSYCKKTTIFGLIITAAVICVTVFIFFPKKSKEDSSNPVTSADDKRHSFSFSATIIEIEKHSLLIEPVKGSAELSSSDRISIPIEYMPDSSTPEAGDIISIQYNGEILESYPAQLGEIYGIQLMEVSSGKLRYHSHWYNKEDLSAETIEWLSWYNRLTEEEQLAVSYVPADLLGLEGLANGSDMETETTDAD